MNRTLTEDSTASPTTNPPIGVVEQAVEWHVLMHSGETSAQDKYNFAQWHSQSDNAQAYRRLETIWNQFDDAEPTPAQQALKQTLTEPAPTLVDSTSAAKRTGRLLSVLILLCLTVASTLNLQTVPGDSLMAGYLFSGRLFADHKTHVGEQQMIVLSDQTRLYLNTFSAVNIEYSDDERRIHLLQGEIAIEVAKDSQRPLVVISQQGTSRALGTRFSVRDRGDVADVKVTESNVEVCAKAPPSQTPASACQQLRAGEQTQFGQHRVQTPQNISTAFISDWPQQQLIVDDQPLVTVLEELSRYHSGHIRIDRDSLAALRVSGVFPLNDIERSLQVLQASLPVSVTTYTSRLILVELE
ncbi:MAG: FecR family protein [Pseudomonadales bacterium]|nr:FecR family protein [Pseudomonadales bacterium]